MNKEKKWPRTVPPRRIPNGGAGLVHADRPFLGDGHSWKLSMPLWTARFYRLILKQE